VDGKPLYEYARQGIPLLRPIEARKVTISRLELQAFTHSSSVIGESGHKFKFPSRVLPENEVIERRKVLELVQEDSSSANVPELVLNPVEEIAVKTETAGKAANQDPVGPINQSLSTNDGINPPLDSRYNDDSAQAINATTTTTSPGDVASVFELEMTVSSGTYVRSVVHDLGLAVGSAAHVVTLTRVQQGQFVLDDTLRRGPPDGGVSLQGQVEEETGTLSSGHPCVNWSVLEKAVVKWENDEEIEVDEDGWAEWELEILNKWPTQSIESLDDTKGETVVAT
jgi:tRNA pseudouridine55 synthase